MESPEALDSFAERLNIRKRIGLPSLEQKVSDTVRRNLASAPQEFVDAYRRIFGNVFNADDAMELFADYAASPEARAKYGTAVHDSARWIRDKAFEQALMEPGSPELVVFMSGGSAVGKSTVAPAIAKHGPILVYDTTLSVLEGARKSIYRVLDPGKLVSVIHIYRPIEEAFEANLKRAMSILGAGRVTSIEAMIRTHKGANETILALVDEFRNHPRVQTSAFDNERNYHEYPGTLQLRESLGEVVIAASQKYGGKPEDLVRDFPQYDRRVNRSYR